MKKALITGITGQDGSYLTELLLKKGYEVHGIIRRSSSFNTFRIDHLYKDESILNKTLFLHYGDLTDSSNLNRLVEKIQPDGMPRKLLDITRLNTLGWHSSIKLKDGLKDTYKWYQSLETHVN